MSRRTTAGEENVEHTEVMISSNHSCAVEMLLLEQVILEVIKITEIEVSVMIEDVTNVSLWETSPKLSMEHVTEIGPGHQGANMVMMGFVGPSAGEPRRQSLVRRTATNQAVVENASSLSKTKEELTRSAVKSVEASTGDVVKTEPSVVTVGQLQEALARCM